MLTDVHCHIHNLIDVFPQAEIERRRLGVIAVTNSCDMEEFLYNEELARKAAGEKAAPVLPSFAIHPQQPAALAEQKMRDSEIASLNEELLETLDKLAAAGRIAAVGECGFDLYNEMYRETEAQQDSIFASHIETALRYDLPVIIHARRAMHKIFSWTKLLTKSRAVIFHSWQGTYEEGNSLLRRGINVYFSFGNTILKNHKQAIRCCSLFPADRLLTETDAPWQPARGQNFSQWQDLRRIVSAAAELRGENEKELENRIENNFKEIFAANLN